MGVVGGGVAGVAEDHFDAALLGIEAVGDDVGGECEELRFPEGYEAADFCDVGREWIHGCSSGVTAGLHFGNGFLRYESQIYKVFLIMYVGIGP